jgi:hypothetical protein
MTAAQAAIRLGRGAPRLVLGPLTGWLLAVAACSALAVVLLAGLGSETPPVVTAPPPAADVTLPAHAKATQVEHAFGRMKPFAVQASAGESRGKDATCSVFSDGNLDTGARVTWAVTLCTVHRVGAAG